MKNYVSQVRVHIFRMNWRNFIQLKKNITKITRNAID